MGKVTSDRAKPAMGWEWVGFGFEMWGSHECCHADGCICQISALSTTFLCLLLGQWALPRSKELIPYHQALLILIPGAFCARLVPAEQHSGFYTNKLICATPCANTVTHQCHLFKPEGCFATSSSFPLWLRAQQGPHCCVCGCLTYSH